MDDLEESLALRAQGAGEWRGVGDPRYQGHRGAFGGWTAALLLKAIMLEAHAQGTPSALRLMTISSWPAPPC